VLHNSTVMMIDDDLTTLEFVQKFLERAGYTRLISTANRVLRCRSLSKHCPISCCLIS
jgi:DNA-binding response OmpR family regulator